MSILSSECCRNSLLIENAFLPCLKIRLFVFRRINVSSKGPDFESEFAALFALRKRTEVMINFLVCQKFMSVPITLH